MKIYRLKYKAKCPHCKVKFEFDYKKEDKNHNIHQDGWGLKYIWCPGCFENVSKLYWKEV